MSLDALMRAIELNGVAVTQNRLAFNAGRLAVENPAALKHSGAAARQPITLNLPERLEVVIERCRLQLARYQSNRYADTYVKYVEHVLQRERKIFPDRRSAPVSVAVATNLHRLMSYKDEYEVARLLCSASFEAEVDGTFADAKRISYHLAPPCSHEGILLPDCRKRWSLAPGSSRFCKCSREEKSSGEPHLTYSAGQPSAGRNVT